MKDNSQEDISAQAVSSVQDLTPMDDPLAWAMVSSANFNFPIVVPAMDGNTLGHVSTPVSRSFYQVAGKRMLDILFVLATLPVSVPITLICAFALWIEGGMPFYRQDRLGKGGTWFSILKLRTMVRDADAKLEQYLQSDPDMRAAWDATQKLKNDPRITPIGGFLRKTSLDELPQLWNVLKGEMSLVGPRPMMPQQLPLYGDPQAYFAILPGITGVWQVSARNETRFSHRAELDEKYLADLSMTHDLGLLLRTVGVVLRRTGY
ncbi:MAG: sugar transferase [Rhodobacteraceae bacterium]|nr:sugar transferase [Paracoccaceae bacterium]